MTGLPMNGPHTPGTVAAAGEMIAEGMRYLNLATRPGSGGLTAADDAYALLGELHMAAGRLEQVTRQAGAFLNGLQVAGRLSDDEGGDAGRRALEAASALSYAGQLAGLLYMALAAAQQATSHLRTED